MLNKQRYKIAFIILFVIIAIFLVTFEFYHTDRILEKDDNCPIGIFEKNSVLFIDFAFVVFFSLILVLLFNIKIRCIIPDFIYQTNKNFKRAPPPITEN